MSGPAVTAGPGTCHDLAVETASVQARAWVAARLAAPAEALEIQTVEIPAPGPNQVRIAVKGFCLDFNDIDTIYGRYFLLPFEPPFVPGMAAAGVVQAAGPGAEAFLGKRVVGTTVDAKGSYASAALLGTSSVQLLPGWLSFTDAAALYFPYVLGWLAIRTRARVQAGDIVLVHAAAGGIGSGVVQLAKAFGATVIATAGTDEKVKFCYELGADYAVNYSTESFLDYVNEVTTAAASTSRSTPSAGRSPRTRSKPWRSTAAISSSASPLTSASRNTRSACSPVSTATSTSAACVSPSWIRPVARAFSG